MLTFYFCWISVFTLWYMLSRGEFYKISAQLKQKKYENKSFTMYKKVYVRLGDTLLEAVVTLEVPGHAEKCFPFSNTCRGKIRVSEALVVDIVGVSPGVKDRHFDVGISDYNLRYDRPFFYTVGKVVVPRLDFDSDPNRSCSSGIHGFFTFSEAKNYSFQ